MTAGDVLQHKSETNIELTPPPTPAGHQTNQSLCAQ